jgi:hypothetical protein
MNARVMGESAAHGFVVPRIMCDRPSVMDVSQRFGPNLAQVDGAILGPGLCCILYCRTGWVWTGIGLWAIFY